MKLHWDAIIFAFIELAILVNLVILDLAVFGMIRNQSSNSMPIDSPAPISLDCGQACKTQINQAVAAAIKAAPVPTVRTVVQTSLPAAKEFFVPLGSGMTQNDQWENIPGVVGYIDTANYTNIQTVYFETSMSVPTKNGVVSARLYDVTDQHPVWFSDVSTDSDVSILVSSKMTLDPGNKQYQVQMKTSLKYPSLLDFARVKIITK